MKVLYLHQHFVARTGTSGGRSHEFSKLLIRAGHEVVMICGEYDHSGLSTDHSQSRWLRELLVDDIKIKVIPVHYSQFMSFPRRVWSFLKFMILSMGVALRESGVDVIFASSTPLTIAVPAMVASKFRRRPFVFEVRDLWPDVPIEMGFLSNPVLKWLARWLEAAAYRQSTHIVALSPEMKHGIASKGTRSDKITVIPNSSDIDLFRVAKEKGLEFRGRHTFIGDRPLVVYAGAFGRVNGLQYLLRLAVEALILDPQVGFLLIGRGSERSSLEDLAEELAVLNRNVFFMDPVTRAELPSVLSAATVLTSFFQNAPVLRSNSANKFFDAMAAGKPIAINYHGWQAELLKRSGAGIVMPPDAPQEGATKLVGFLRDSTRLDAAAVASRSLADHEFDRELLFRDLEQVLVDAAG